MDNLQRLARVSPCVCQRGRGYLNFMSHRYVFHSVQRWVRYCGDMKLHSLQKKICGERLWPFFPAREMKWNSRASLRDGAHVSLSAATDYSTSLLGAIFKLNVLHVKIICRSFHPHHDPHLDAAIPCYTRQGVYAAPAPTSDHGQRRVQKGWNSLSHALA